MGPAAWKGQLAAGAVLAVPTAVAPGSTLAGAAYLVGLTMIVGAVALGARGLPPVQRRPWQLLAVAAGLWLLGDVGQRAAELFAGGRDLGIPDACWLGSYPFEIAAVNALVTAKGLPRAVRRDLQLDVLVVATAVALGAWHVLVAPALGSGSSVPDLVLSILYPLGDVVVFSLVLVVLMMPGAGGPAGILLVACLGLTLPFDFLLEALPSLAPSVDPDRLDAALLVANALLGAAALHPRRGRLTEPAPAGSGRHLQAWRLGVLGASLFASNVASVLTHTSGLAVLPDLIATLVVSLAIIVRFSRAARAQERATDALRNLADHDQLTGVANRVLLRERLGEFLAAGSGLLFYIDLDGFKSVNDSHGHHVGDAVLRAAAERLSGLVRSSDTVARIGGDEFVVLLHGAGRDEAVPIAERVWRDLCRPIEAGGCTTQVGASVGVVVFDPATNEQHAVPAGRGPGPQPAADALYEQVLRRGDEAMYEVKRRGGGVRIVASHGELFDPV